MKNVCPLCELNTKTNIVLGEGPLNADVMFVGECPGPDEDKLVRPFVGKAGKIFRAAMKEIGINEEKVFITNIVKCFPKLSLNPSPQQVEACSVFLEKQIEQIKPKIVVSIGRISTTFFFGKDPGITKVSGKIFNYKSYKLMPIVHPSYLMRNFGNKEAILKMSIHLYPLLELTGV